MRVASVAPLLWIAACAGPRLEMDVDARSARVSSAGAPFAEVHYLAEPRPFVGPLLAPGGVDVTCAGGGERPQAPSPGVWLGYGDVDGYDFWRGTELGERIALDSIFAQVGITDAALVQCEYVWRVIRGGDVLRETRQLQFRDDGDVRTIDVLSVLRPVGERVVFGDAANGGFALRLRPELRGGSHGVAAALRDSEGLCGGDVSIGRARWLDASGVVGDARVGVAVFDHPDNLRHPARWRAGPDGLLVCEPFAGVAAGATAHAGGGFELQQGRPLKLRYRVVLHRGMSAEQLDAMWSAWAAAR